MTPRILVLNGPNLNLLGTREPAQYGHETLADLARLASELPVIEVHLSNVHKREPFRHLSFVSSIAVGVICGLGSQGYRMALGYFGEHLREHAA
jgi:3-dehydroquinate dehydratase-2